MKEFDRIKDMVYNELDNLSRHEQLNKESVCVIGELVDILKDIGTVEMFEEGFEVPENEYSLASYGRNGGYSRRRMNSYDDGNSYRGRYYNSGYYRGGRGGYSRDEGKEYIVEKLNHLMNEAHNEEDKEAIKGLVHQMENN